MLFRSLEVDKLLLEKLLFHIDAQKMHNFVTVFKIFLSILHLYAQLVNKGVDGEEETEQKMTKKSITHY